ncbi:hypothetical protein EBB07_24775 [Paenibacillaceae bacterium]|nr:hypothetical protein EBB07_24775 [Paenibacillaceae bacterium]
MVDCQHVSLHRALGAARGEDPRFAACSDEGDGTVYGMIMGILILHEKQGTRQLWVSLLFRAGIIILGMWGVDH